MKQDRISIERLQSRVSELYANNELDYKIPDFDYLATLYDEVAIQIVSQHGVVEQREWSSYGCGFASYFESWFFFEEKQFVAENYVQKGKCHSGVMVIFSLLEPMFAAGQSEKQWDSSGGSGLLPSLQMIDEYKSLEVHELSRNICRSLREAGIPQASRRTLEELLDPAIQIESNLSEGQLKIFDAFFHWMD